MTLKFRSPMVPATFHRHEPPAAELFRPEAMLTVNRSHSPSDGARASARIPGLLVPLLGVCAMLSACHKKQPAPATAAPPAPAPVPVRAAAAPLSSQLAAARLDAAKARLASNHRDEALALLVAALKADPNSTGAAALTRRILTETIWNFPALTIRHQWPVEQLAFAAPSSLWVSLAENQPDGFNSTILWNTSSLKVESVLFPVRGTATRSLVAGQNPHAIVVQRGTGPTAVNLLCDAQSLRPLCDIGPLPEGLTPQSVIASSPNGLLIAHPGPASATDPRLVWRVRDAASGEVVRSSEPTAANAPRPLAAQLDSKRLRVVHADGSLLDLPVSPVEPAACSPPPTPLAFAHAHLSPDGATLLALLDRGPDAAPVRRFYQITEDPENGAPQLAPAAVSNNQQRAPVPAWAAGLPWSREPSVWTGLLRDHGNPADPSPASFHETELTFGDSPRAPIHSDLPITAAAFGPDQAISGTADGTVVIHRFLPPPASTDARATPDPSGLANLTEILCGMRFDESNNTCVALTPQQRLGLLDKLPPATATTTVPGLDFTATLASLAAANPREAPAAALLPLWDRLARSDRTAASWPRLLELTQPLADSLWHQDLTEAAALRAETPPLTLTDAAGDPSPWLAQRRIRDAFSKRDGPAILAEIQAAGTRGPAAATAFALALDADSPEWINACLQAANDLPPILRLLGESRVAWLEKRMADAISPWPDEFPDFVRTRLTEDWDGWEQEDFAPRYAAHLDLIRKELAGYEMTLDATPEARAALAARLLDPATRAIIGRRRLADDCLKAALALAPFPEDAAATVQLANRARALGATPEPCLRAEALAYTRLGDYKSAHPCWITLLTEHPVNTHLSNDYAEAAYTAFENGDPNQALEILTTGIARFPDDPNFALRAGWIALLTGNGGRAYHFLLAGLRIGYPEDKRENSCLLLTVAAAQAGFPDEAAIHYQNLLDIAPVWAEPDTIDALDWPEELKASLLELAQ